MNKKIGFNVSKPSDEQLKTLLEFYQTKQYVEAEKLSLLLTQEFPKHPFAWKALSTILKQIGRFNEALVACQKSLELNQQDAEVHYNMGVIKFELGRLNEAEASYRKAIALNPDFEVVYNNLGNILIELGKLNEAETSFKKAIELKPDYIDAHNNWGNLLYTKGDLLGAINRFKQAININPDFFVSWFNIYHPIQVIKSKNISIEDHLPLFDDQNRSKYSHIAKSILSYRLNQGGTSKEKSLKETLNILISTKRNFIKNPKLTSSELIKATLPEKIIALVHFGRSGTGLIHSLIDGHPEISTLPSIYFNAFFDLMNWKNITIGGWEEIVDRFVETYEVLFDASTLVKTPSIDYDFIYNIGKNEGMTNVGPERNEILSVDKKVFVKELKKLINCYDELDAIIFFKLVHSAYEVAMENTDDKKLIFYHIHNPDTYTQLNYLRLAPNTNWLMMVREPLISCESWIRKDFNDNNYKLICNKICVMLFQIDQSIYQNKNSVGVKLEDLKKYPKKTILSICKWLGINEEDSLYEMTAQGKRWWGDPSGENYEKDGMDPFGKSSIKRKLGSIFNENDQYILGTLFYPFSVRFGYTKENLEKFKNDLQRIRPMLDQIFDFENKIVQNKKMNIENFIKSGSYLYLRSRMIERWNTLNKLHTYPNMIPLLKIN